MPEKIKIFSLLYTLSLLIYFLLFVKVLLFDKTFYLWLTYIIIGVVSVQLSNMASLSNSFDLILSIIIGLMTQTILISQKSITKTWGAITTLCIIALLGCLLQMFLPDLLLTINRVTLGSTKFDFFYNSFFIYDICVGFSFQTGVTSFYLGLLCGIIMCKYFSTSNKNLKTTAFLLLAFIITYTIIFLTRKRGELVVVALLAIGMMLFFNKDHRLKSLLIILIFIIIATIVLINTELGQKMINRTFTADGSSGRSNIYIVLINNFIKHPIFGSGLGSTLVLVTDYTNGHNIYLQILSETGIIGFLLMIIIFGYNLVVSFKLLKNAIKTNKNVFSCTFCVYIQLHFLLLGFVGNPLYDVFPLVLYLLSCGISFSIKQNNINNQKLHLKEKLL